MFASRALFFVVPSLFAAAAAADTVTVPRGALVHVRIDQDLNSDQRRAGDPFAATVVEDVYAEGRTAIPAGSVVDGVVTLVKSPARGHRSGVLGLRFVRLRAPDGQRYSVDGALVGLRTRTRPDGDLALVKTGQRRAVVVIGDEADGPGKRPSSLVGNDGEAEDALAERWGNSGLSPQLAEIEAGAELTFELRRPLDVERPATE
jgi:hypothetical protein